MKLPLKRYEETPATYDTVRLGDRVIVGWWAPVERDVDRVLEAEKRRRRWPEEDQ